MTVEEEIQELIDGRVNRTVIGSQIDAEAASLSVSPQHVTELLLANVAALTDAVLVLARELDDINRDGQRP